MHLTVTVLQLLLYYPIRLGESKTDTERNVNRHISALIAMPNQTIYEKVIVSIWLFSRM